MVRGLNGDVDPTLLATYARDFPRLNVVRFDFSLANIEAMAGSEIQPPSGGVSMKWLIVVGLLCWTGCTHAPPTLSPEATDAYNKTRAIKGLDILRDTAIDANAQDPPLLDTAITRKVVLYHDSAVRIIVATGDGWRATVLVGLDELLDDVPPDSRSLLVPYVALVKSILGGP